MIERYTVFNEDSFFSIEDFTTEIRTDI